VPELWVEGETVAAMQRYGPPFLRTQPGVWSEETSRHDFAVLLVDSLQTLDFDRPQRQDRGCCPGSQFLLVGLSMVTFLSMKKGIPAFQDLRRVTVMKQVRRKQGFDA
jgi:hypothetical protein